MSNDREEAKKIVRKILGGVSVRVRDIGRYHDAEAAILAYGEQVRREQREADAQLAEDPYSDEVQALGGDEPKAVGRKIAAAILGSAAGKEKS